MKTYVIWLAAAAALGLAGCRLRADEASNAAHHGRYVGVGIYQPQQGWTDLAGAQPTGDGPDALTVDDEAVIVVTDSDTGEVGTCGDLSGYCIGMNPWSRPLPASQAAPVDLLEHAPRREPSPAPGRPPSSAARSRN